MSNHSYKTQTDSILPVYYQIHQPSRSVYTYTPMGIDITKEHI